MREQLPSGLFTLHPDDFSEQGNFPMESQMQQYVWTICDGFCCVSDAGIQLTSSPHSLRILQLNQSLNSCRSRPCRSRTYHFSSVSMAAADGMTRTSLGASKSDVTLFSTYGWMRSSSAGASYQPYSASSVISRQTQSPTLVYRISNHDEGLQPPNLNLSPYLPRYDHLPGGGLYHGQRWWWLRHSWYLPPTHHRFFRLTINQAGVITSPNT